jgi:hypothetical protein
LDQEADRVETVTRASRIGFPAIKKQLKSEHIFNNE